MAMVMLVMLMSVMMFMMLAAIVMTAVIASAITPKDLPTARTSRSPKVGNPIASILKSVV